MICPLSSGFTFVACASVVIKRPLVSVSPVDGRLCQGRRGEAIVFTAVSLVAGVARGQGVPISTMNVTVTGLPDRVVLIVVRYT